jgi:hypothetical protein
MSNQEFLFDKRIAQRNVTLGLIDQKTLDKVNATLPDRADNVTTSTAEAEAKAARDGEDDAADDDDEEE